MSYKNTAQQRGEQVDTDDDERMRREPMPCRFCGGQSTRGTLAILGSRCAACYDAYVRQPIKPLDSTAQPVHPAEKVVWHIRQLAASGSLTRPQRAQLAAIERKFQPAEDA